MSTKFVESFNALTGGMYLMTRERHDTSETLQINCKDMSSTEFVVEPYDECETATITAPFMEGLTMPLGYSL
jgi:hypothetical protein